jgi:hypothetical protein
MESEILRDHEITFLNKSTQNEYHVLKLYTHCKSYCTRLSLKFDCVTFEKGPPTMYIRICMWKFDVESNFHNTNSNKPNTPGPQPNSLMLSLQTQRPSLVSLTARFKRLGPDQYAWKIIVSSPTPKKTTWKLYATGCKLQSNTQQALLSYRP